MIYFTSDLHFCHDRQFLFQPRGFTNIEDHNKVIVENWNNLITDEDDVYILGDLMLNNNDEGIELIKSLKGQLHIIIGNHDSDVRVELYRKLNNIVEEPKYADVIKYKGYRFYLSHYPTFTSNLEKEHLSECLINLYGHTHQKTNFYNDIPFMYHVGLDSHNNKPVSIDDIIWECKEKAKECINML